MCKEKPQTKYLTNFLNEIGHSVHCMNTIAIALSNMTNNPTIPENMNISWKPNDVELSSKNSRRYAVKSSIVYGVESLYTYLAIISENPKWLKSNKSFNDRREKIKSSDKYKDISKAEATVRLLKDITTIQKEWIILVELLCHWRNKVVHISNANISKKSKQLLLEKEEDFYKNCHHFSVKEALNNFDHNKFTLKDVTTLLTITIKTVRLIDEEYIKFINMQDIDEIIGRVTDGEFKKICKQDNSKKKTRQLVKWLTINCRFLTDSNINDITAKLNS